MHYKIKRILISFCCLIFITTSSVQLIAQVRDTCSAPKPESKTNTVVTDKNINFLNVIYEDTSARFVLAQKVQPAIGGRANNYEDSLRMAQSAISKTITFLNESNSEMALASIYQALNFCPVKEAKTYAIANSYYGLIQIKIGNYTKAVTSLNMCDSLYRKLGNLNLLAFHYNNLGLFYQRFDNEKMAENLFNKSLSLSRTLRDNESIAISLNNLSKCEGDVYKKISYLLEAIEININLNKQFSLAENYNNLAFLYGSVNNYTEAIEYLDKSLLIVQKTSAYEILYDNFRFRSEIYGKRGMYKQAYESISKMQEFRNELIKKANTFDIEQMIQNRILSKKQYELDLRKKEYDIKRLNASLIISISLLIITILIFLYIYFYINSRRKIQSIESKQKITEHEVEYAQSELVNLATYLNTRNEILDSIQGALNKSYKLPEKEVRAEIRKINMYIRNLQTRSEEIDSVLAKITKINEGFISRLSEMNPDLTKNDKNIALFLRAQLSTKQIATLMDCSPKSVNMARYRMRTHLNLKSDINLVSYLRSL